MERGDHLISPRTGYSHHGLFLGRNQVIHYTGFSSGRHKGIIAITSLEEFCQGEGFTVQSYPFRLYSHEESADRACSRLGEDWYDILLNNCEHFVTWCILGVHHSHQINRLISAAEITHQLLASPEENVTTTTLAVLSQNPAETLARQIVREVTPVLSSPARTVAGIGAAAGATVTTATVVGLSAVTAASAFTAAGVGVAASYGVKKLVDWVLN